jgi:hypothetical protein
MGAGGGTEAVMHLPHEQIDSRPTIGAGFGGIVLGERAGAAGIGAPRGIGDG